MLKTIIWDGKTPMPEDIPRPAPAEGDAPAGNRMPGPKFRAVALGIFDGVHLGHRAVISRATGMELPDGTRATAAVFTFVQPPWALPKDSGCELLTDSRKAAVLESLGVEELIQTDFETVRDLSPRAFVEDFLHAVLHARRVCCGFNYRFGKGGAGDAAALRMLCAPLGIEVEVVPPVLVDGEPVSASRIRRAVEAGEVEEAARLLGRPFTLDFPVVGGQKLGRLLGTPTINQPLPPHFVRPRFGVYAVSVEAGGRVSHGVTNIGVRPTVGSEGPLAETWISDFQGDLYGRNVPVTLVKFLRPERKFDSVEALQKQILLDGKAARRAVLGETAGETPGKTPGGGVRAVLFDFDDTLQDRAAAFLQYCDFFFDKYFPALPPAERERRRQEMLRRNNGGYVNYIDYFLSLFEEWGWKDAPPVGDIYREFQFRFPDYVSLLPDAEPVLRELRRRGFKVGVITNGPSLLQNRKLDVSGLRPLLDIAVVSGDENVHKPDPEIFRRTAARLGVACASCLYVGDHPVNDIEGARAAGMRPVYINAFGADIHPENAAEIARLTELLELV